MCVEVTHCHVSPIEVLTRLAMATRGIDPEAELKKRLQTPREVDAQSRRFISTSLASSSHAKLPSMIVALKPESEWCTFANKYSLEFLCPDTHVDVQPLDGQQHYRDYAVIKESIEAILLQDFQVSDVEVVCNQAVKVFKDLKSIFSSQRIVVVYWKKIRVLVIEVHSSPSEWTVKKLALVLVEQPR